MAAEPAHVICCTAGFGDSLSSNSGKTITSSDSSFPNHIPVYSVPLESSSRRSRPSFLDSLNVARPSSGAPNLQPEKDSSISSHLESSIIGTSGSTYFHNPSVETKTMPPFSNSAPTSVQSQFDHSTSSSISISNNQDILSKSAEQNSGEKKLDFYAPTKNEDFAALEQVLCASDVLIVLCLLNDVVTYSAYCS